MNERSNESNEVEWRDGSKMFRGGIIVYLSVQGSDRIYKHNLLNARGVELFGFA